MHLVSHKHSLQMNQVRLLVFREDPAVILIVDEELLKGVWQRLSFLRGELTLDFGKSLF